MDKQGAQVSFAERWGGLAGLGLGVLGTVIAVLSILITKETRLEVSAYLSAHGVSILEVVAGLVIFGFMALSYLQGPGKSRRFEELSFQFKQSEARVKALTEANQQLRAHVAGESPETGSAPTHADLVAEMQAAFQQELTPRIREELLAAVTAEEHLKLIDDTFKHDVSRSNDVIQALRRRGNFNLVFGVGTTLLAAAVLVYTAVTARGQADDVPGILKFFIPRISTVVFIETFGFFFLKLYKSGLDEERYHQDEITAKVARHTALHTAMRLGDTKAMAKLIEILAGYGAGRNGLQKSNEDVDLKQVGNLLESAAKVVAASRGGK